MLSSMASGAMSPIARNTSFADSNRGRGNSPNKLRASLFNKGNIAFGDMAAATSPGIKSNRSKGKFAMTGDEFTRLAQQTNKNSTRNSNLNKSVFVQSKGGSKKHN